LTEIFDQLYGNEQLKTYITSRVADGTLPHALIFEGPTGSGKTTAALMTSTALAPAFADKIKKLATPDVTLHEPTDGKKSIGVSLIRDIKSSAFIKPQELDVRIFIIRQAQTMTTEAQNSLLKILEEPPRGVFFFLLCDNASLLLPTVRSRAPVLKMSVFSDEELAEYMLSVSKKAEVMYNSSPDDYRIAIRLCSGTIGQALERIGSPTADADRLRSRVIELIKYLSERKRDKILLFFVKGKTSREELIATLDALAHSIRDMLKLKYGKLEYPQFFINEEEAEEYSATFARSTLMSIYTECELLLTKLNINVNVDAFCARCADALTDASQK
jgi:DNA polymerase-3 subunit delta'